MAGLRLNLLGGFELLSSSGGSPSLPPRKARALLAFLALGEGRAHARDKLATLLWADGSDAQARSSLRQALTAIRRALGADAGLRADTQSVAFAPGLLTVDVLEFEQLLAEGGQAALWRAVELYTGDLLEGFRVDAPGFEAWLAVQQERLRRLALQALSRLAAEHAERGQIDRAIDAATRLLALDPLHEQSHRQLMRLYLKEGRQAAALRQYRLCREILRRELGVAPEAETEGLHRDILQRRRGGAREGPGAGMLAEEGAAARAEAAVAEASVAPGTQLREAVVMAVELAAVGEAGGGEDVESIHGLLTRCRGRIDAIVGSHEGRIASSVGGRLVAVFGVPVAFGNDAEHCVRAALAIVRAVTESGGGRMQARIGIAGGPVLAEWQTGVLFVTGEPLDRATRIQEAAAPGELWAEARVRDALAARLEVQRRADLPAGGMAPPLQVWQVVRCGDAGGTPPLPLVGRAAELHQLAGMAEDCVAARRGQVVLVRGEAGIGKSRLLQEFAARAGALGLCCHKVQVFDVASEEEPIQQLLRSLLGLGAEADADALRHAMDRLCSGGALERTQQIVLHPTLGVPQPAELVALYDAMEAEARQRAIQELVCSLAQAAAAHTPRLILVEDVHWAGRETLGLLAALAAGARTAPILLLLSAREDADPIDAAWRAGARGAGFTAIDLPLLDEHEAGEMAAHYPCTDPERVRSCIERAHGNPLFLDQLLRSVDAGHGPLPGSVQSLVLARLDRLAPRAREALQAAAVLGQQFSIAALRHLVGIADEACAQLLEQVLIRREGEDFLFIHALVQEAVYASMLKSRTRALHARAAEWFAGRDVVLHAEHLELAADAGAARAYLLAARVQAQKYHYERALRLAERGLALAAAAPSRFEALALRGRLLLDLGRVEQALDAFHTAAAAASTAVQRRQALTGLAAALRICDRPREALLALDRALDEAPELVRDAAQTRGADAPTAAELAEIHLLRGNLYFPLGELDACLAAHEQARACAAQSSSPPLEARALSGLGDAYYQRAQMLTAHRYFDRCIALCEQHGIHGVEAVNLTMRAATRLNRNDLAGALADAQAGAQLAAQIGDLRAQMLAESVWASALSYATDWHGVARHAGLALEIARRLGARRFEAEILMYLGIARWQLEGAAQGERVLEQAQALCVETGATAYFGPPILAALAAVSTDPAQRRAALAEGEALLARGCVSHCHLLFYEYAIDIALEMAEWCAAEHYADALEAYARVEPTPWSEFLVRRGRALAQAGAGDGAPTLVDTLHGLAVQAREAGIRWRLGRLEAALDRLQDRA